MGSGAGRGTQVARGRRAHGRVLRKPLRGAGFGLRDWGRTFERNSLGSWCKLATILPFCGPLILRAPCPRFSLRMRHIIAILLQNEPGALTRVAGLFSTRGYNI